MVNIDYNTFAQYLYAEYIKPRAPLIRRLYGTDPGNPYNNMDIAQNILAMRNAEIHVDKNGQIYGPTPCYTVQTLQSVHRQLQINNQIMYETSIAEVIADNYAVLIDHIRPEHILDDTSMLLEAAGIENPTRGIVGNLYLIKAYKEELVRTIKTVGFSQAAYQAEYILNERMPDHLSITDDDSTTQKRKRGLLKGASEIAKGIGGGLQALAKVADPVPLAGAATAPVNPAIGIAITTVGLVGLCVGHILIGRAELMK